MHTRRLRAAVAAVAALLAAGCAGAAGSHPAETSSAGATPTSTPPTSTAPTSSAPTSAPPTTSTASRTAPPSSTAPVRISAGQLAAGLSGILGTGNSYSVAALDLTTGRSARAGAGGGMVLASLVKLDILETLLYQRQLGGRSLSDGEEDDAEAMIDNSDNAAGDRLFEAEGENSGLAAYHALLGLHDTVLDPDGQWGLSTTSAADQLLLVRALVSAGSPLNAASRKYALDLLGDVEADQRWGVSAAADKGSTTHAKNGWLNIDRDNGLWAVTSAGVVRVGGHPVLMVVLSQHQPDFDTAVDRVERAAKLLATAL
ncbi:MAG: serine hydrolase [Actinobacteria bacterium]|nr:serine hydrolase [Actinomycetota bacterium]